jgi:hypothetical protein
MKIYLKKFGNITARLSDEYISHLFNSIISIQEIKDNLSSLKILKDNEYVNLMVGLSAKTIIQLSEVKDDLLLELLMSIEREVEFNSRWKLQIGIWQLT